MSTETQVTPHYYAKTFHGHKLDVYAVCKVFGVTCPAVSHAVKKLLRAGQGNGGKDYRQDLSEAQDSITRAIELAGEDGDDQETRQFTSEEMAELRSHPAPEQRFCQNTTANGSWCVLTEGHKGACVFAPATPTTPDWHNPQNVPADKIPEGWRFRTKDEAKQSAMGPCRMWRGKYGRFGVSTNALGDHPDYTYIVPQEQAAQDRKEAA